MIKNILFILTEKYIFIEIASGTDRLNILNTQCWII
ncbi:hypothetical protein BH11BAC5_BH11BAC5_48720 [soil metagenome]